MATAESRKVVGVLGIVCVAAAIAIQVRGCDATPVPPSPDPVKKVGYVIIVEPSGSRTTQVARVYNDHELWASLSAKGVGYRFYSIDSPDAAQYRTIAEQSGLPTLFLTGPKIDGKVELIHHTPMPPAAQFAEYLRRWIP